jgi:hypothetical protein
MLALAVIAQAIEDTASISPGIRADATAWLFDDPDGGPNYTFDALCGATNLSPDYIRAQIRAQLCVGRATRSTIDGRGRPSRSLLQSSSALIPAAQGSARSKR